MKVPLSWLRDYVDFEADASTLAERLTSAGIQVESIEQVGSMPKEIIIGEIVAVEEHRHANQLVVCNVNNGSEIIRVVCGAKNCKAGDRVALAGIGAMLPNGAVVKEQKINGESSKGMLCAEDELNLSQDHAGIMILPPDSKVGQPLAEMLGPSDYVLTLEITPNRPDLLGMLGIAREVAALFGTKLKQPSIDLREEGDDVHAAASVTVEDGIDCPRYNARVLTGAVAGQSPFWLRRRLALAGIRAVNNMVDITNYVLLECGQPLHAFDLKLLSGNKIIVRRARNGEKIEALDEVEYKLDATMLVIADASRPVAIAGVMGGAPSGIQTATTSILLESACFKPALIRQTSKQLGLTSESSYRFERGVDINQVDFASRRACALMAELAGAKPDKGVIDVLAPQPSERQIICRYNRTSSLLGINIPAKRITAIFNSLDLPVIAESDSQCTVKVKTFRPDLETEADLIEEIARINGLEQIPGTDPHCHIITGADDKIIQAQLRCHNLLAALGLREIVNYSFVSDKLLDLFDDTCVQSRIVIPRPVSAEYSMLRDSLTPQMGETLGRNRSRQIEEAAFFEIGRVFFKQNGTDYHEETRIAVGLMGAVGRGLLQKRSLISEAEVFAWLKGILRHFNEKLSPAAATGKVANTESGDGLTIREITNRDKIPAGMPVAGFKPKRSAMIMLDGIPCGVMGLLKDKIRREWRILEPLGLMEIQLDPFLKHAFQTPAAGMLPVYPSITRDIALRVPAQKRHSEIIKIIWKNAPKELTSVELFDIYTAKEIGRDFKSMAYSLKYQSLERTLTDDEVNRLHESVKTQLRNELKLEIREG